MKHLLFLIVLPMTQGSLHGMMVPGNQPAHAHVPANRQHIIDADFAIKSSHYDSFNQVAHNLTNEQLNAFLPDAKAMEAVQPSKKECLSSGISIAATGIVTAAGGTFMLWRSPDQPLSPIISPVEGTASEECSNCQMDIMSASNIPFFFLGTGAVANGGSLIFYGVRTLVTQWNKKENAKRIVALIEQRVAAPAADDVV